jgi:predicted transcriptional regulator
MRDTRERTMACGLVLPRGPVRHHHYVPSGPIGWPTVTDDPELAEVVSLLDDDHVRTILAATSAEPRSAAELGERCGVSESTVYRRVDRLTDADLVAEQTRPRPDGHHETVYVATLARVEVTVEDGSVEWTLERDRERTDVADELARMWGEL